MSDVNLVAAYARRGRPTVRREDDGGHAFAIRVEFVHLQDLVVYVLPVNLDCHAVWLPRLCSIKPPTLSHDV